MNVRTAAASALLALGAVAGVAGAAAADPAYPPTTPSPGASVLPTSTTRAPAADPAVESDTAVLGTRVSALPRTGGEILVWSLVGGALVAGGAGAVVATRRRTARQH